MDTDFLPDLSRKGMSKNLIDNISISGSSGEEGNKAVQKEKRKKEKEKRRKSPQALPLVTTTTVSAARATETTKTVTAMAKKVAVVAKDRRQWAKMSKDVNSKVAKMAGSNVRMRFDTKADEPRDCNSTPPGENPVRPRESSEYFQSISENLAR